MLSSYKLPFDFDPESLKRDLDQVSAHEWVAHFNKGYFEGGWTGVALRSIDGSVGKLYIPGDVTEPFVDSPLLDRCPNVRAALALLKCPLRSVRFLRLSPGSVIREHRDYDLGFERGQLRLHVPVTTNSDVLFFLDAYPIDMKAGECWYLDLSLPHWIENRGPTDRVHLVIDCELNDWLRDMLPTGKSGDDDSPLPFSEEPSSPAELERFRLAVFTNLDLQRRFQQTSDRKSFVRLILATARDAGYHFAASDVENAMQQAQVAWLQRWND